MNCRIFTTSKYERHIHLLELQVKGNLLVYPQIWTVASLTHNQHNKCLRICIYKYFFSERDFSSVTLYFINPISTMFCNFSLK